MAARWDGQALREPISAEQPCGQNLDDTTVLSAFDSLRLFGQTRSPEAPPDADEGDKSLAKARPALEWDRIRADALDGLSKSKDLRLLAYLGAAVLRTDGLPAFAIVLSTASHWLEAYWPAVYPLLDEDAIARRNALNCLADPMAVVDRVWRLPLIDSRQHGRISLRDIDISRGQASAGPAEEKADPAALRDAFAAIALEDLTTLERCVADGVAALNSIDARMRGEGGPDVAPDFAALSTHFAKVAKLCRDELAARSGAGAAAGGAGAEGGGMETSGFTGGALASRQDAIRALDAVADYFRRNEPSSPIPLLIDRAKRLVAKDFLEVLADIAPDAVAVARSAGGLRDQ
jgi:type VI secretion system protein ImpA